MKVLKLCFETSEGLREALGSNFLCLVLPLGGIVSACIASAPSPLGRAPQSTAPSNVDGRHSCRRRSASNPRETRVHYTKPSRNQLSSSDACRLPYMKINHISPVGYRDILPHTYIASSGSRTRLSCPGSPSKI